MAAVEADLRHLRLAGAGVELHVATAGTGPPVVLLHGFPENWRSWRHQVGPLVAAGFSVWLPDLRGYNLSDRPVATGAYHLRHLVDDLAAVVRATGAPRAHVGGHDWGGIVAWTFAGEHPELLDRLVILNSPHPRLYGEQLRRPGQLLRAWYILAFLVPGLAERALAARDFALVRRMFGSRPGRPGAFTEEAVDAYVEALAQPGALTAALNYYRANRRTDARRLAGRARVAAETLVIWGERDPALSTRLLDGLERVAPRARVHRIRRAGHWVQNEAPEEVNRVLLEFLRGGASQPGEGANDGAR
jgi:epoxide hydrolase 4